MDDLNKWLKWAVDNKELILAFIAVVGAAGASLIKLYSELTGAWEALMVVGGAIEEAGDRGDVELKRATSRIKRKVSTESELKPRAGRRIARMVARLERIKGGLK